MNAKLLVKVLFLALVLLLVVMARQQLGSAGFKEGLSALFGGSNPKNATTWCVDNVVDVLWTNAEVAEAMKDKEMSFVKEQYCILQTEPIANVDLSTITWAPLAESRGPTGQLSKLEWNKENGLFKAGGMPFKSTWFAKELNSKLTPQ